MSGPSKREWKLSAVAKELGVCSKTIKKYLPFLKSRQPSPRVTYIPGDEVIQLKIHGLHGLKRLRLRTGVPSPEVPV